MSREGTRVGLFREDEDATAVVGRTIKLSNAIIVLVAALFSVGAGVAATLVTAGELRLRTVAADEVTRQQSGIANRLIVLEAAVANSVTREELLRQEQREKEWRGEIMKGIADLREEIRLWHNADTVRRRGGD